MRYLNKIISSLTIISALREAQAVVSGHKPLTVIGIKGSTLFYRESDLNNGDRIFNTPVIENNQATLHHCVIPIDGNIKNNLQAIKENPLRHCKQLTNSNAVLMPPVIGGALGHFPRHVTYHSIEFFSQGKKPLRGASTNPIYLLAASDGRDKILALRVNSILSLTCLAVLLVLCVKMNQYISSCRSKTKTSDRTSPKYVRHKNRGRGNSFKPVDICVADAASKGIVFKR
jgi:hypothetical protein